MIWFDFQYEYHHTYYFKNSRVIINVKGLFIGGCEQRLIPIMTPDMLPEKERV